MIKRKKTRSEIDKRLINLVVLNIFLIASGILWLDYMGLINFKEGVFPTLAKIPGFNFILPKRLEDPLLLAKEEYRKQELVKKMEWDQLKDKQEKLEVLKTELEEKENSLKEQSDRVKEKELELDKKYSDQDNYRDRIGQQAKYFVSMRPEDAVNRLSNMDDLLVIDILKAIEKKALEEGKQSIVPYFLSLMTPEKASVIQRKMTIVEEDIKGTNF
ncbi:MAG: hypothetical protein KKH98_12775 [Spirochaetes bacterium]|nr:hypothetical protein [Spirochaetota bacterium]